MNTRVDFVTTHDEPAVFAGFDPPSANWYRMPDNWVDISAQIKNLAELKVVQYILRHTWGYREYGIKKHITVDEFVSGRRRRDGSRMDRGTGLAEQSVRNGLTAALRHGWIEEFVDDADKARIKKYYGLKMRPDAELGVDGTAEGAAPAAPASASGVRDVDLEVQVLDPWGPGFGPRTETHTEKEPFELGNGSTITSAGHDVASTVPKRSRSPVAARVAAAERAMSEGRARPPQDDPATSDAPERDPIAALRIKVLLAELSRTFDDEAHRGSNAAQAMNLFVRSQLPVAVFEQRLYDAAALTRDTIQQRRLSARGQPIEKPMAYFFRVVRDGLDLPDAARSAADDGARGAEGSENRLLGLKPASTSAASSERRRREEAA